MVAYVAASVFGPLCFISAWCVRVSLPTPPPSLSLCLNVSHTLCASHAFKASAIAGWTRGAASIPATAVSSFLRSTGTREVRVAFKRHDILMPLLLRCQPSASCGYACARLAFLLRIVLILLSLSPFLGLLFLLL